MISIENMRRKVSLPLPLIVLIFLCVAAGLVWLLVLSYAPTSVGVMDRNAVGFSVMSGIFSGFILMLLQFLFNWKIFLEQDRISSLKIVDVLRTRADEDYYGRLISGASDRIDVLGVTASRFLEDFASKDSPLDKKKVLISALIRGVKVKILVPKKMWLPDEKSERKFDAASERVAELIRAYPAAFEVRYLDHPAMHSMVRVDRNVIVGPIFSGIASENTPAIHADIDGHLSKSYFAHFEGEWNAASLTQ